MRGPNSAASSLEHAGESRKACRRKRGTTTLWGYSALRRLTHNLEGFSHLPASCLTGRTLSSLELGHHQRLQCRDVLAEHVSFFCFDALPRLFDARSLRGHSSDCAGKELHLALALPCIDVLIDLQFLRCPPFASV